MDGVIAALHAEWYRRYNRDWNDNLTLDRVQGWEVDQYVKPECGKQIFKYLRDPDLYEGVPVIEDSVWGVNRLRELGHRIIFASSCYYGMVDQKGRWLERHGFTLPPSGRRLEEPDLLPEDYVPITPKLDIDADMLIDDSAGTIKKWVEQKRRRAILVEYPHNAGMDLHSMHWQLCKRARTWQQIVQHVEAMG